MKFYRVSHPSVEQHFRTLAEARKLARDIKMYDIHAGVKASHRITPEIAEITTPPVDKNLIVDILNGQRYILTVRVVGRH